MIDLKLLQHAQALAKHRNFARAADALDLSQPALSRSISGLEAVLGVQLFHRTRQGVEATAFGERLLARGNRLLTDAAELERELKLMQGLEAGVLRIGAGPYAADMCVGPAMGRMALRHPHLRLELNSGDWRAIIRDILLAQLDLAVIELSAADGDPRLITEALPKHVATLYCRAGHPLLSLESLAIEQVFGFPFACCRLPARVGAAFYRLARTGAIDSGTGDYLPPIKVDTIALAKAIVLSSDAIALAPLGLIANELAAGELATLPLNEPRLHTEYGFVYLKDRVLSPAAQAFIGEARVVEAELVETERRVQTGVL